MTTYSDFIAQVRRELEESSASVWSDSSLLVWANDAMQDYATRTKVLTDEVYTNTAASQRSYDLPDYTLEPRTVWWDDNPLTREPLERWRYEDITEEGEPYYYTWQSGSIYLRPIPTSVAELRVFRHYLPTPVASVTATSQMPFESRGNAACRHYIKARAFEQIQDFPTAQTFDQLYERSVDMAVSQQLLDEQSEGGTSDPVETY